MNAQDRIWKMVRESGQPPIVVSPAMFARFKEMCERGEIVAKPQEPPRR